ncbi:unnamed protein product [Vicia faba]|uniref:Uncharacterized protein n=1 Tax=Vicia faba TaxID=3906 RepID=A0AAV1AU83_VICFA|nr:unnamed protein product [Vicia faba]
MLEKCKRLNMKLMSPLQEQAHSLLTCFDFQKFQEEFERSIQYPIHHENGNVLVLRYYKYANSRKYTVFWDVNPQSINVVFDDQIICYNNEAREEDVVQCPPISKTKGHPKRRRIKSEKELSHSMNICGLCRDVEHNITTCSLKENIQFSAHTKNKKRKTCQNTNLNQVFLSKI